MSFSSILNSLHKGLFLKGQAKKMDDAVLIHRLHYWKVKDIENGPQRHKGHKEEIRNLCALCVFVVFSLKTSLVDQ